MVILQVLLVGAAIPVALFYFGWGAAELVPRRFAPFRLFLTPLVGMALVVVWDYLALFGGLNLTQATWLLAGAATLCNALVVGRAVRREKGWWAWFGTMKPVREQGVLLALAAVAFFAAAAPLLRYGYVTIIGENWDYEFYLPLADLLRVLPTAALSAAPPNPLLTTILSRHIFPLPMGFSYLQGTLDTVLGLTALDTFAILLAVLHALGVSAAFLFLRGTFKMSPRAALVATAFLAFNGLLLWFTYWNFGLHLAALALLPVAVMFGAHALLQVDAEWIETTRALVTGGLFLAALNVTYHPALVAVALSLGLLGLYRLVRAQNPVRVLGRGAALIGLTLGLSFPVLYHIPDLVREYYGRAPLAIGLREFVPLSDGYGFSLRVLTLAVGHIIPTPWVYDLAARLWDPGAPLATGAAVLLSLYALWRLRLDKERRAVWYCIAAASVFYVALFRLPFLRPYPYGFLKSLSLVSYILIPLAVQGGAELYSMIKAQESSDSRSLDQRSTTETRASKIEHRKSRIVYAARVLAAGAMIVFGALTGLTFGLSVEQYFKPQPAFFDADMLTMRAVRELLPPGATVYLTDRAEAQGIPMGLAAYLLREHPLYGNVKTGYGALNNLQGAAVYDYALLARGEDANGRGYASPPLWANTGFALYSRQPGVVAQRLLNLQTTAPQALKFTLGANDVLTNTRRAAGPSQDVTLALASFVPQQVTLSAGKQTATFALAPGLSLYQLPDLPVPTTLVLTPTVAAPLLEGARVTIPHQLPETDPALGVPYVQWHAAGTTLPGLTVSGALLVRCTNENAGELDARCFVANPRSEMLTWRWIVRGTPLGTRQEQVMAQAQAQGAPRSRFDISARTAGGVSLKWDDAAPLAFDTPPLPDGSYRGTLEILRDGALLARLALYNVRVKGQGTSMSRDSHTTPLVIVAP